MPTPLQHDILEALAVRPMTVTDLSIQLNRTPRAIANSLSSLRGLGLVSDGSILNPANEERVMAQLVQPNNPVLWSLPDAQENQ
jgi:DNA-binding transcriptional ArsR family regulator